MTEANISSTIICFGIRSSQRSLISSSSACLSSPHFSRTSLITEKRTFSLMAISSSSSLVKPSGSRAIGSTMPFEMTNRSLPSSHLTTTFITPACSISIAFCLVSTSPGSAISSPVYSDITGSATTQPGRRLSIESFLLYLYLPTREISYLWESKKRLSNCC